MTGRPKRNKDYVIKQAAEGPLKNRPTLSPEDISQIDQPVQGNMRSLGGRYIDGTELHRLLDEDASGILEDNPVMNWTEEDVKRFGIRLELKDGATAPKPEVRRVAHGLLPTVREQLRELLDAGIIERGRSSTGAPIHLVPKPRKKNPDGTWKEQTWRTVIDFRAINRALKYTSHPTPNKLEQSQLPEHYAQSRYKEIYNTLDPRHRGKRARKARAQVTSYSRRDDMLYYHYDGRDNPLLVVPQERMQHRLIEYVHDTLLGHASAATTLKRLRQQFWWEGMTKMVNLHVLHCKQCNRHRPRTARPYMNLQRLHAPKEMGTHYAMDLMTDLPPAGPYSNPYDMVLVLCDKFSGRIFGFPTRKSARAADIAEIIDAKLIHGLGRGMMLEIRCDNDTRFGQKVFGNLMANHGVQLSKTSPGHSTSNAAERSILALEIMLRGMCITARHWLSRLPFALFALNTKPLDRLGGLCPLEIEHGRMPLSPLDLTVKGSLQMRQVPKTMKALFERFSQIRAEVNECKRAAFDQVDHPDHISLGVSLIL